MPNQYLNVGVSEQNMINVASGLALSGKIVFCYSIASFATMRCYEQIKVNLCSMNLPVIIVGAGAGFSFGFDGPTHHGLQDLSSMRLLPEMTIVDLSSNDIAKKSIQFAFNNGPLYIRLDKGPFADWSNQKDNFKTGFRVLKKLESINIIVNGYLVQNVIEVAKQLENIGVNIGVVDVFKVKPISETFLKLFLKNNIIITVEEGSVEGGLGTTISEIITRTASTCKLRIIGAPDKQLIEYGDRNWFHKKYGLDINGIKSSVQMFLNE